MVYDALLMRKSLNEFLEIVKDSKILKIGQPSKKIIELTLKTYFGIKTLIICEEPSGSFAAIASEKNATYANPSGFLMLLRKYLLGGFIENIEQIGLERIFCFTISHINEIGKNEVLKLYLELMGRKSNMILCDAKDIIIAPLIKVYESEISTRNIVGGASYDIKNLITKHSIFNINEKEFINLMNDSKSDNVSGSHILVRTNLLKNIEGISNNFIKLVLEEKYSDLLDKNILSIEESDKSIIEGLKKIYNEIKLEFTNICNNEQSVYIEKVLDGTSSISEYLLNETSINVVSIKKTNEENSLKKLLDTKISKMYKKLDLQESDLEKCAGYEKYKTYGELINVYGYDSNNIRDGKLVCKNYMDNDKIIEIPYDVELSVSENAKKNFDKYNKLKRTNKTVSNIIEENKSMLEHLLAIRSNLELSENEKDLSMIKKELLDYGFLEEREFLAKSNSKKNYTKTIKGQSALSAKKKKEENEGLNNYLTFKSSDGVDILVGKNNLQNEYLSFTVAHSDDTWFHVKGNVGSHVIVRCPIDKISDTTLIEAARLAAKYSSLKNEKKVEVDYTPKKELHKVPKKTPGFVIYHKNYSIVVDMDDN